MRNGDVSTLLSICGHASNLRLGTSLHAAIFKTTVAGGSVHRSSLLNYNSLISMYSRWNDLASASKLFDEMAQKDAVTYNSMLSAIFRNTQNFAAGVHFYNSSAGMFYDHATLTTILSECESARDVEMMHSVVWGSGYRVEVSVGNALLTAYFRCELPESGRKVFDEMSFKNVITWTAMISGLRQVELYNESLCVFHKMRKFAVAANPVTFSSALMACGGARSVGEGRRIHGIVLKHGIHRELHVESTLMDMYSKSGTVDDACRVFESIWNPDKISQTVILVGLAQNNLEEKAVELFVKMVNNTGIEIDADIVSGVLGAFGDDAPLSLGKQIHSLSIKKRFDPNVFVSNGLINMYSKSGDLQSSYKIFTGMTHRNAVTWTSIISASARHGLSNEALHLYETMRSPSHPDPTDTTFLSLLHACSHAGAVKEGMKYLKSMSEDHNIEPRLEHYACVVDMLGRAARLEEAKLFIENLPVQVRSNTLIWQTLLGACGIHGDLELGRYAAEKLQVLAPNCPAGYVLLANLCSFRREWRERGRVLKKMRDAGVKKDVGMSWIEIAGVVHKFVVGDETHWKISDIYQMVLYLMMHCRDDDNDQ